MTRRIDAYKWKKGTNLASWKVWGPILEDLDLRLAAREDDSVYIQSVVSTLEAEALQRLNDTFTPLILEAEERLNSLGASFSAESLTEVTLTSGLSTVNLLLTHETTENYVYTDYVSVRAANDETKSFLGRVISFQRETPGYSPVQGTLELDVEIISGDGTFDHWLVRVGTPPEAGHAANYENPHKVTAGQLGNPVGSAPAYTKSETDAMVATEIAEALASLPPAAAALLIANNLSDLNNAGAARTNLGLGQLAVYNTVAWGLLSDSVKATAAQFRNNMPNVFLSPNAVWAAAVFYSLSDDPTIEVDLSKGINFWVTIYGNRILGFPKNIKVGQSGYIGISPADVGYTLGFEEGYGFYDGIAPVIDTSYAWRHNVLAYTCIDVNFVMLNMASRGIRW